MRPSSPLARFARSAFLPLLAASALASVACGGSSPSTGGGNLGSSSTTDGGSGVNNGSGDDGSDTPGDAGTGSTPPAEDTGTTAPPVTSDGGSPADSAPAAATTRVVGYLPNYNGSYADWATKIDFSKMTHLNLAFATANSSNQWDMGASDSDVAALVTAAHAAGVKVIASLGGGGGDQTVIAQFKDASNVPALVSSLDTFISSHDLDGADIDIEDPANLGDDYATFVAAVVKTLRPEGKLVTAAVAQYLQDSMGDTTLHSFDFINVMIYSNYNDSVSAMTYYTGTKNVPAALVTLGAGFFGTDSDGNEYAYTDILAADSTAWSKDVATVSGKTVNYTGVASMQKLADYSKGFGGIMFWEMTEDTTGTHSLYKTIQESM